MELRLPQAMLLRSEKGEARWLASSPEFPAEWQAALVGIADAYGVRPEGARCPLAEFALPFAKEWVVVARVADVPAEGPPAGVGFHFLVLRRDEYAVLEGDPFFVLDQCPADWQRRGTLPLASLATAPPRRCVVDVVEVIKRADGPTLLGAAQALVDGCRVAWVREAPDPALLRAVWALLPTSTRRELWPATFAFGNALGFDALVVPRVEKLEFDQRYLSEEQAANYPEGRYELTVQAAAEAGDQAMLDAAFARRSRAEIWRMGFWLLGALIVLTLAMQLLRVVAR